LSFYNAAGIKIEKKVHDTQNNTIKQVEYMDGFQYAGGVLQFFPTAEGYVAATESNEIANPFIYNYVYNYTDHLGNIRLSYTRDPVSGDLEIMEENHSTSCASFDLEILNFQNLTCPFGLKHAVYADPKQMYKLDEEEENLARPAYVYETEYQYKFQGQERQDELGLNWDSFKWRNYMPDIGRFFNIDPLTEEYVDWGPYVFSGNRVIDARELKGLEPHTIHDTKIKAVLNFAIQYNGLSIRESSEIVTKLYTTVVDGVKVYSYTTPSFGTQKQANPKNAEPIPEGATPEGIAHTHGSDRNARIDLGNGEVWDADNQPSQDDIDYAKGEMLRDNEGDTFFTITPNGSMFMFEPNNPKSGRLSQVKGAEKVIPSDPQSQARQNNVSPDKDPEVMPLNGGGNL